MRERVKTSLISLVCGAFVSMGAVAAPTVRSVGGDGTYTSAASATTARSGSLRPTGTTAGGLRPSVSTTASTTTTASTETTTGSVSSGGGTVGRVASSPRLSIGKYIGAPKSMSTTPVADKDNLLERVEKLETDVERLETDKQDTMSGSDYIIIDDDEIVLDLEKLRTDLELKDGKDGRAVEMGTNDTGLLWRYVGDTDDAWQTLITWDEVREKLDINGLNTRLNNLKETINTKLDNTFPDAEPGAALIVGADGTVTPTGSFVNKQQDAGDKGKVLVIGEDGVVQPGTYATGVNPDDLGDLAYLDETDLGKLAWEDSVTTEFITDSAVTRAKFADDIASVLSWIEWWKKNAPGDIVIDPKTGKMTGDGMQYVLSVDNYGNAQWFRVITGPEPKEDTNETTEP